MKLRICDFDQRIDGIVNVFCSDWKIFTHRRLLVIDTFSVDKFAKYACRSICKSKLRRDIIRQDNVHSWSIIKLLNIHMLSHLRISPQTNGR